MKQLKKLLCLSLVLIMITSLCACGANIAIPDVEKLDVDTAKTLLAGKGLIPKVEYEYNNDYDYDLVIRTEPAIGSSVEEDTPVTLYVCKGPSYYELPGAVSYLPDIENIEPLFDGTNGTECTKGFYAPYAKEGYLYITVFICCKSKYPLEFNGAYGTASINDTFAKTVPITVIYDSKKIGNKGEMTEFTFKIPLGDLGVQKPTNIFVETGILVGGEYKSYRPSFDLSWQ